MQRERCGLVEVEADGVIVDDGYGVVDVLLRPEVVEADHRMVEPAAPVQIGRPAEAPLDIGGGHLVAAVMEFHTLAQGEGDRGAVLVELPAFRQQALRPGGVRHQHPVGVPLEMEGGELVVHVGHHLRGAGFEVAPGVNGGDITADGPNDGHPAHRSHSQRRRRFGRGSAAALAARQILAGRGLGGGRSGCCRGIFGHGLCGGCFFGHVVIIGHRFGGGGRLVCCGGGGLRGRCGLVGAVPSAGGGKEHQRHERGHPHTRFGHRFFLLRF